MAVISKRKKVPISLGYGVVMTHNPCGDVLKDIFPMPKFWEIVSLIDKVSLGFLY